MAGPNNNSHTSKQCMCRLLPSGQPSLPLLFCRATISCHYFGYAQVLQQASNRSQGSGRFFSAGSATPGYLCACCCRQPVCTGVTFC
jgi:hypothetical protein